MLELRHLRSLLAIAETRTLADAAERVHLTQSALSHQIRALEAHYGVALFERTSGGLRFTPAGERLLALARDAVAAGRRRGARPAAPRRTTRAASCASRSNATPASTG